MRPPPGQTPLVLASASPRRRDLLEALGFVLDVVAADVDETPRPGEGAAAYVQRLAREKAQAVARGAHARDWVLGADTTVVLAGDILGKPADAAEARAMLWRLAGRTHEVLTGVALAGRAVGAALVRTRVRFRPLSAAEVDWYVATGEPLDKAGAYAVQGKGGFLVASLEGSPTNVVGLPLGETLALLEAAGFPLPWRAP